MVYIPVKRNNVFDDLIDDVFGTPEYTAGNSLMKTDIREKDGMYYLDIDLPGFRKEDIKISLYNGTLTVTAEHRKSEEEKKRVKYGVNYTTILPQGFTKLYSPS